MLVLLGLDTEQNEQFFAHRWIEFLLLSLVFSVIFQRPIAHTLHTVTYHCTTQFLVAPEDVMLPKVSLSADSGDSSEGFTTQSYTSSYKLHLRGLSPFLPWSSSGGSTQQTSLYSPARHGQNWAVQLLRRASQDPLDTKAHCQNIQSHKKGRGHVKEMGSKQIPFANQPLWTTKIMLKWPTLSQTEPKT